MSKTLGSAQKELARRILTEGHPNREIEKRWADDLARSVLSTATPTSLRWITDRLNSAEVWIVRHTPGAGKPWFSPIHHALVTLAGWKPYPVGPFGIALRWSTGNPWLWLLGSTWTWLWYFTRERREHGGAIPWRLDPVLDVVVPGLALDALWWLLLWGMST